MATSDLVLRIIGQDQASPAFNQVAGASKRLDAANKQVVTSQSRTHRAFSATAKILTGLATGYAGIKIKQFVGESITAASDLNEAMSATDQVFKKQSNAVKQWSTTSVQSFGQTRTQALNTARQYGTLFKSAGLGGKELRTYSTTLTELASDIASFNNVPVQQAIDDMTSGLSGQVEPMRKYGVFLSANALKAEAMRMGIAKGTETLTDQQRTLAAYNLILRQTGVTSDKYAKQSGDFQRTAAGYANQTRILAANWQSVKGAFGQAILPLATSVVTNLNQVLPKVTKSLTDGDLGHALEGMVPKVEGFFSSFSDNLPELKSIASDFGDAFGIIGRGLEGVFNTFNSLPDGVRQGIILLGTAAATMKMLNRAAGGGGMTMFSQAVESIPHAVVRSGASVAAAEAVKAVFGNRIGTMQIQAGVVNVNGGKVNGGGGPGGGAAGKGGSTISKSAWLAGEGAGLVSMLSSAAVVSAITVAAGAAYYKLMDPMPKIRQQGGNPTTLAGGYGSNRTINTSKPQIRQDWVDKQAEVSAARYAAQWKLVTVSIKDASGAYTQFAFEAKNKKWVDEKQPRAIDAAAARYKALAKAVKDVPDKKTTRISTPGADDSKSKIKGLGGAIGGLKGKTVPVKESGADPSRGRVNNLKGSIGSLRGKQVNVGVNGAEGATTQVRNLGTEIARLQDKTVTVYYKTISGGAGKPVNKATGGRISGPGTGTSDDVPLMASNGEYIIQEKRVRQFGVGFFDALNAGVLPRFAKGGKVKAAKRDARWQEKLAQFITTQDLSDPAADWFTGLEKKVQRAFMKHPKKIGDFARMAGSVQDRRAERDAQRSRDQAMAARGLAAMDPVARKNTLAERVAQTNKELANTKGPAARARLLAKLQDQEEQLAAATSDLSDAQAAQEESAKAADEAAAQAAEDARKAREADEDAALDKVNQLRDAVDGLAGGYRSFASISTTAVNDVADAQSKLTDANDKVADAQKRMDLAGSDRERAAAAADLAKALQDQQAAQKNVNDAGKPTSGGIRGNMASRLQKLKGFGAAVKQLKANGLNATTLADILQMGPEQGYDFAQALLSGGLADINDLQNQITAESASLGYFQMGTNAASDQLTGAAAATAIGVQIAPAPVTLTLDGAVIAKAMVAYGRQNGGTIPGWPTG